MTLFYGHFEVAKTVMIPPFIPDEYSQLITNLGTYSVNVTSLTTGEIFTFDQVKKKTNFDP